MTSIMGDNQTQSSTKNYANDFANKNNNNNNSYSGNTTRPTLSKLKISVDSKTHNQSKNKRQPPRKKKRRDKSDLGDNFVAPDGGWGWLVAIAAGICTLVTFALGQQFGIVFRVHMSFLDISSSKLTTIINTQIAVSALTGLLNGPLFRRFSYRQVALMGSTISFIGLFFSVFANTFIYYILSFSCLYGFGRGLLVSSSSMAVNTYFKQNRRTATAYLFGVAGLGPIFFPHIATYLLTQLGVQGTVLIFTGISLNTFACALIYQPVKWHVKEKSSDAEAQRKSELEDNDVIECVAEPETPVLPHHSNAKYNSQLSLNKMNQRNRLSSWDRQFEDGVQLQELKTLNNRPSLKGNTRKTSLKDNNKELDQTLLQKENNSALPQKKSQLEEELDDLESEKYEKVPFYRKIIVFFDLDLLNDLTYVNLAIGLTLINFVEINFAILTPFILSEFGFANIEIAMAMSALGFCDLVIRFMIPLITSKINYSNKTLFSLGILGMCAGRFVLTFTRDYYCLISIFMFLGLNKAFRTVCWGLIIPEYVPLKRLPAAAGLQLLISGIFSLACGPIVGFVRDATNFAVTIYFLNGLCIIAIILWIVELFVRKHQRKSALKNLDIK